jgi:hypothetical protein
VEYKGYINVIMDYPGFLDFFSSFFVFKNFSKIMILPYILAEFTKSVGECKRRCDMTAEFYLD